MSVFQKSYNTLETQSESFPEWKFLEHAEFCSEY